MNSKERRGCERRGNTLTILAWSAIFGSSLGLLLAAARDSFFFPFLSLGLGRILFLEAPECNCQGGMGRSVGRYVGEVFQGCFACFALPSNVAYFNLGSLEFALLRESSNDQRGVCQLRVVQVTCRGGLCLLGWALPPAAAFPSSLLVALDLVQRGDPGPAIASVASC